MRAMRPLPCLLALLVITLAPGCAPMGAKPGRVEVTSEPAGADVYAMGSKVGVTPLTLDQDVVFPLTYPAEKQTLYGVIELRKAGCADARQGVSTRALARGIHVRLDCGEAATAEKPAPSEMQPAPALTPVPAGGQVAPTATPKETSGIEQRLRQVKDLRDKGLITEQEAQEIRRRILDEL